MRILLAILFSVLLQACTQQAAVDSLMNDSGSLAEFHENLVAIKIVDLQAADARAVAGGDMLGHACYPVLIKYVQAGLPGVGKVAGVWDAFEAARLGAGKAQGGIPDDLRLGCAPLFMDVRAFALRMAAIAGSRGTIHLP